MQPQEVTWALVVLACVQAVQAIVTGWFAHAESKCLRQLRYVKHELENLRHRIALEGQANRISIEGRNNRDTAGGRENMPPAV